MKIAIGADHAGYELKEKVKSYLVKNGIEVKDFGVNSPERADYPDYAHPVASAVENKQVDLGIVICGSGNGVNMTANRHHGVRSALCWMEVIAVLARQHNDANVMALPARYMDEKEAQKCVDAFLNTPFEGGRHTDRVNKIEC